MKRVFISLRVLAAASLSICAAAAVEPEVSGSTTNSLPGQVNRLEPVMVIGAAPAPPDRSASVVAPDEAALRGVASALDFTALSPGLAMFQGTGDRLPQFSVRGLRDNTLTVGEPQVALYVDDVAYDDVFTRGEPLFDLERVDFLRGPQGMRFGASRPGGVLDIHTRLPGDEWQGRASASYGNYNAWRLETGMGGPVVSNLLQVGVAGLYSRRDGFVHNVATGTDGDMREAWAGRANVRWTPVERLEFIFTASGHRFDDGLQPGAPQGQDYYTVARTFDGFDRINAHTESIRATFKGDAFKATSITAFSNWREALYQDSDYQPADIAATSFARKQDQWTQEFRVQSQNEPGHWRWQGGGYFSDKDFHSDVNSSLNFFPFGTFTNRSLQNNKGQDVAVFGQGTYELSDKVEVSAGLRWENHSRDASGLQVDPLGGGTFIPTTTTNKDSKDFNALLPQVELAWRPANATRLWAGVARGFQAGGFSYSAAPAPPAFGEVDSWHYELGAHAEFSEGAWSATGIAFYNDVRDYQVFRPTGFGSFAMLNAARAHAVGFEGELVAKPCSSLRLALGGGVVSAKFDEFTDASNGAVLDHKDINFVPNFTLNASATWTPCEHLFLQTGVRVIGDTWFDEGNTQKQSAYALLDARVGWETAHWGVAVFGRNVTDTHYAANAIHFNQPGSGEFFVLMPGEPAMYGVELSVRF